MSKRVLIVVSSYAPAMPANMHRARMLAWYLKDYGWDVELLSPSHEFQQSVWIEPHPAMFFASGIRCWEAPPTFDFLFRLLGMHSVGWRSWFSVYLAGNRLLSAQRFDLIFFSTTAFNFFCLGRIWERRFGVPYVLDFQDPWYRDKRGLRTSSHWIKAWIGNSLARYFESFAVRSAKALVSVSPRYLEQLKARYPKASTFAKGRQATIPFGALPSDALNVANLLQRAPSIQDNIRTIAYVGVGGVVMQRSFRRLAAGLGRLRQTRPDIVNQCRIRLTGTQGGWKEGDAKILWNEAYSAGIGDLVVEDPSIVSYSAAVSTAVNADGLLVLGVDDRDYMPSKLFLYAFTGKPLLACMHWQSQINDYFKRFPDLGLIIHFGAPSEVESDEDAQLASFLKLVIARRQFERDDIKAEYSAKAMSRQHADLFDKCVQIDASSPVCAERY
jgi:hypothetical protein